MVDIRVIRGQVIEVVMVQGKMDNMARIWVQLLRLFEVVVHFILVQASKSVMLAIRVIGDIRVNFLQHWIRVIQGYRLVDRVIQVIQVIQVDLRMGFRDYNHFLILMANNCWGFGKDFLLFRVIHFLQVI